MNIQIGPHTLIRAKERGANETEIIDTINTGTDILARGGRIGKAKVFEFNSTRNEKYYKEKKIDTIEQQTIITVTVYVFYGKF